MMYLIACKPSIVISLLITVDPQTIKIRQINCFGRVYILMLYAIVLASKIKKHILLPYLEDLKANKQNYFFHLAI